MKKTITLERTYQASLEEVWDLWTTKEGIESWWGPDGYSVKVRKLELRPGGKLEYAMTATAREQIDFMKRAGMPLTVEAKATYTEVSSPRLLAYDHLADFIPGIKPYPVTHRVELQATPKGVRMALTVDVMHDQEWTQRMSMGWENELGKLANVIAGRAKAARAGS